MRIYLALCLILNLFIYQVDIVEAYMASLLDDNKLPIFMKLPPGIQYLQQIRAGLSCRLLRSLYGLKQSRRLWNQNVIAFYKSIRLMQLNGDPSILIRQSDKETSIVSIYVDDFLLASNIIVILNTLKEFLTKEYDTKDLSEIKTIIEWQINRDTTKGTMKIDQSAFIRDLVIKEKLTDYIANTISMKAGLSIEMGDLEDYKETDLRTYQQLIGKLMYLAYGTRPNITFAVR